MSRQPSLERVETVGALRQQSALQSADTPVIVVSKDPSLSYHLLGAKVLRVYPDIVASVGVFKIELGR